MKLWKWILGLFAAIGGTATVVAATSKKQHNKKVNETKKKVKQTQAKTK